MGGAAEEVEEGDAEEDDDDCYTDNDTGDCACGEALRIFEGGGRSGGGDWAGRVG